MTFLHEAFHLLVAGVLALTAATGAEASPPSPPPPAAPSTAPTATVAPQAERDPSADAVEPPAGVLGSDISWPQCPPGLGVPARRTLGKPLPSPSARYVVIGLTNGPGFTRNPCLGDQVAFARSARLWTSAYAVVTYPSPRQLRAHRSAGPRTSATTAGRLYNAGFAQARANLRVLRRSGLRSPTLWLDVEPVRPPAPWSGDTTANRWVVEGSMAAYREAGLSLGVYSTPYLWATVVGDARYGLPEWRAAGPTSRARALAQCAGPAIQGGPPVLAQWTDGDSDFNVLCPGTPPLDVLRRYFSP